MTRRPAWGIGLAIVIVAGLLGARIWGLARRSPALLPPPALDTPMALPPFDGVTAWLNASEPITPEQLRGKVTLVVFWASSNARALRVLPILTAWAAQYREHGLELIGVHSPEFPFERSVAHVQHAVDRFGITFPVAVDSDRRVWAAYRTHEWPAYYVANAQGHLLGFQIGAGREAEIEAYVRGLLTDSGYPPSAPPVVPPAPVSSAAAPGTPEMVFQLPLRPGFASPEPLAPNEPRLYTIPTPLPLHGVALDGVWQFDDDQVRVVGPSGRVAIRYRAARCYLIVDGEAASELEVRLDGGPVPAALAGPDLSVREGRTVVRLDGPRSYRLIDTRGASQEHRLEVTVPKGASVYACTFS